MNERMRRYLSEDWDSELDDDEQPERERKKPQTPQQQARRQSEKQWGRAMAKFLRDRQKTQQKP